MRTARVVCALVVFGLTVIGIVWVATYQVVILYADHARWMSPVPPTVNELPVPPWWNGFVAVGLAIVGVFATLRVLPERHRLVARARKLVRHHFARALTRCRTGVREWSHATLRALDWLVAEPLRLLIKH